MLDIGYIIEDKYQIIKVLGIGGMGTVYLCKNISLGNLWAIKEIKKNYKINIDILSESNILKKLDHPCIPRIVDIFYKDTTLYMVQDYIEGQTLKEYLEEKGAIEPKDICHIISSICDIIGYLHNLDPPIIYRDLKPSNIIITPKKKVVLIDFGISKTYKIDKISDTIAMGSLGYAAPEQRGLGQSCMQTDIYGIGMVMYFIVTGKIPSSDADPFMEESYNNINSDFKRIIQKAVRTHIEERYSTVEELNNEIVKCLGKIEMDQTMLFTKSNIKSKPGIKLKNHKLKKCVFGLLVAAAVVLAILYFIYDNHQKYSGVKVPNQPKAENIIESVPTVEKQQPTDQPANNDIINKDATNDEASVKTEANTNNSKTYEKQYKGKGSGKRK